MTDTEIHTFRLPDLGEGLTEAEIARWLVDVGDVVAIDQPVVEVETAKAQVEVPCPYAGVVAERYGREGEELPVGAPLVAVAVPEAAGPAADVADSAVPESAGRAAVGAATAGDGADPARVDPARVPDARRPAGTGGPAGRSSDAGPPVSSGAEEREEKESRTGDGGSGQVLVGFGTTEGHGVSGARARRRRHAREAAGVARPTERVTSGPPGSGPPPVISPLVRRLAREHGIDLRTLRGSGPDGLVLRADVERARAAQAAPAGAAVRVNGAGAGPAVDPAPAEPEPTPPQPVDAGGSAGRVPLTGITGAAADKFTRSRREIPDATCWVDADATELLATRRAMGEPTPSLLALLARVTTAGLARYPQLNATVDTTAREIVRLPAVHLGFAAQTDRGLVVPVVRDAHTLSTRRLHEEMARLTARARSGGLSPGQLTGSTFTLNNYGVFGVDGSTPILNHPEAGMLGVGRITEKPWAHEGRVALRQVVQLSFTFDHRVCDGGVAGGFLRWVADCVEQPARLLREV